MKPSEALRKGLAKLGSNGEHWTQGNFALDASGKIVSSGSSTAHYFCSIGAVKSVNLGCMHERRFLHTAVGVGRVTHYNDTPGRTFPEIKAMFERAIALAEAEESKVA